MTLVFQTIGDVKHPTLLQSNIQSGQQNHSGSELSSSSTNGDKVTPSDSNANHETNDKFIFSSTSMEFAVSRKVGKYRQKNVSSDDINGHKQASDVRPLTNNSIAQYFWITIGIHFLFFSCKFSVEFDIIYTFETEMEIISDF